MATRTPSRVVDAANVDPMKKIQDLGEDEVNRIRQVIEAEGLVEGDLRKEVSMNIKRLIEIGTLPRLIAIAGTCRSADNGRTQTPALARVRARELWRPRRNRRQKLRRSASSLLAKEELKATGAIKANMAKAKQHQQQREPGAAAAG